MEAMHRLAALYLQHGQQDERAMLLAEIMATHDGAGIAASDRSLYIAAAAASALAEQAYLDFQAIPLRAPLKQSLQTKNAAMQSAILASQRAAGYGVQEFSTLATLRMGQVYQQLSSELLDSERPVDIDALALEQYELLLEEQAFPFEEKAIAIFETNVRRSWEGVYDQWVQQSFDALAVLLPARYLKPESGPRMSSQRSAELASDMAGAQRWFEQGIDDHDSDLALYNQYGIFLREQGRFDAAEQVYLEALTVRESDANIHRNLGILYDIYRGDRNRALQHFYRYQALSDEDTRRVSGWIADLEREPTLLVQGGLDHD
jgi:tetratricopeptide (TPR) repeat protein